MYQDIHSKKLYEQVVSLIKQKIADGTYKKGELLPSEKDLMEMTGVSRITVREAIRILKEAGLIETKKGKGSIVLIDGDSLAINKTYDPARCKSFLDATKVLSFIEPEICREVAKIATPDDILNIYNALNNTTKYSQHTEVFHLSIARVLNNQFLEGIYNQLQSTNLPSSPIELVEPEHQKTVANTINLQHSKIFEAIKAGNSEFAYFYMKEHLSYIYNIYEDYIRRFF